MGKQALLMPPLLTEQFHTCRTHHSGSQQKKKKKEWEEGDWPPPPRWRKPQAGELSARRAPGEHRAHASLPPSHACCPSNQPRLWWIESCRKDLQDDRPVKPIYLCWAHWHCSKLVINGEVGRLCCGFCKCISSTLRSLREPARTQKRESCLAEATWVSRRHWTRLLTALRSPGTRLKVSSGQLIG